MTPEAQRIAIERACGWECDPNSEEMIFIKDGSICGVPWPSLDAMHEAESGLGSGRLARYREQLRLVCGEYYELHLATAAQRAEAFLRTLNLWKP